MAWQQINQVYAKFKEFGLATMTAISLCAVYFVGIGITAVVAKTVGKKFLATSLQSSWKKVNYSHLNPLKMY